MSSSVRPQQAPMQRRFTSEDDTRWEAPDAPLLALRSSEETEALIARLNDNLNARMADNPDIADSLTTLRRMRAHRTRHLRRR